MSRTIPKTLTAIEQIESFIVAMKLYHGVSVTEINFDQRSFDKMNLFFKPKESIDLSGLNALDAINPSLGSVCTNVGVVDLGVKENA